MYFRILNDEATGLLTYLLADLAKRQAVLIDPHAADLAVLTALLSERDLRLNWVLRTHHHDGLQPHEAATLCRLGAPLIQGDAAAQAPQGKLDDDTTLLFGDEVIRVLTTPGHTTACLSFGWRDRLFCGGLLAVTACPHQPLPQAPEALWDSVTQKLFTLPDETLLFAGHEHRARAVSTVLEQRRWHPLFSGLTRDEFLAHTAALAQGAAVKEDFLRNDI